MQYCVLYFSRTERLRCLSFSFCVSCSKLEPQLTEAEQFEIVGTSLKHCLAVPPLIASSEKKARDASFQEVGGTVKMVYPGVRLETSQGEYNILIFRGDNLVQYICVY